MHQHIRELIAENEINEAIEELRAKNYRGDLGARVLELRRRWSELRQKDLAETEHARDLRIDENRFVKDFIQSLDWLEDKSKQVKTTPTVTETSSSPWLKYVVGVAAFLLMVTAVWYFLPSKNEPPPVTEAPLEVHPSESEGNLLSGEEDALPSDPKDPSEAAGQLVAKPELSKQFKELTPLQIDQISKNTTTYNRLLSKYFLPGSRIDIAVVAYRKTSKGSGYDQGLSESIAKGINKQTKRVAVPGTLNQAFHDSEFRQAITYGRNTDDKFLNPRAKYVLIVEITSVSDKRTSELGLSVYNTTTNKPETKSASIRGIGEKIELLQIMTRLSEWSPSKFQ